MRDIKFRIWNGKSIQYPEDITQCKVEKNDVTIMQYTGLHDRQNKDIYEGDIILDGDYIGIVKWLESEAQYIVDFGDGDIDQLASVVYSPLCKIIGDIYCYYYNK